MSPDDSTLRLTLYIAGQTPRADRAISNLRRLVQDDLGLTLELRIVDVLERPDLAEQAMILATPTLVREDPGPSRRLIGDLSDGEKVLRALQLDIPRIDNFQGDDSS